MTHSTADRARIRASSLLGVLTGGVVFVLTLLNWSTDIGRAAYAIRYASGFFEIQARALMRGHLDIPRGSMGIEGFNLGDHTFMYYGPFPALLRIPVLMVTDDFDGRLTLVSMLAGWIVFAVMTARLCWLVRRCVAGERPVGRLDAVLAAVLLAAVTGGTTLTYDAGLPWAYHEVYVWQSAFVLGTCYWILRVVLEPTGPAVGWLAACVTGAALTRTTGGVAMCLAVVALAAWFRWGRLRSGHRHWAGWVLAAGLAPLVLGIVVNMAKFGHPFMFPLEYQEWTAVNAHRRAALEANGGSITGPQFFPTAFVNYFSPLGIRFVGWFPWVTLPAHNAEAYAGAFVDQTYRTGSVTAFMPLPLALTVGAVPLLLRRARDAASPAGIVALRVAFAGCVLMTGGVMAYGYVAHRYTSEFVPALVVGSLIAGWGLLAPAIRRGRWWAAGVLTVVALGTVWSLLANAAIGSAAAAETYGGPLLARFIGVQDRISGGSGTAFAGRIHRGEDLPGSGDTDDIYVRGGCDGVYLNTGDRYWPWVIVEERGRVVRVRFPDRLGDADIPLFEVHGNGAYRVRLRTDPSGLAWVVVEVNGGERTGALIRPAPGEELRIGVRTDAALGYAEVESSPGGFVGYLPIAEFDRDWINRIRPVEQVQPDRSVHDGIEVTYQPGIGSSFCADLLAGNGHRTE